MPYEQGLAHFEIARHLASSDAARVSHLAAARDLFGRLHAARALAAAGSPRSRRRATSLRR